MDDLPAWSYHRPRISLWQVKRAWLLHRGTYYPVETMPSAIFKAVVLEACPSTQTGMHILLKDELDIVERWYILLRTTNGKYPLQLFYLKKEVFC